MCYHTYQRGYNQALAQMMQALALRTGVDIETFLTLPAGLYDTAQQDARATTGGDIKEEQEEEEN